MLLLLRCLAIGHLAFTSIALSSNRIPAGQAGRSLPSERPDPRLDPRAYSSPTQGVFAPKIFIITMFDPEGYVWLNSNYSLTAMNISVPGFSPVFPAAHCNAAGEICLLTTGEAEINAAATMTALAFSPLFDLRKTYFFITGIAGVNPNYGTLGSATFAKYAVQVALEYEYDARDIPANWATGYLALGSHQPNVYLTHFYGSEIFELNEALRDRAFSLASSKAKLADSATATAYRSQFTIAPANQPPNFVKCDTGTSDVYWLGSKLAESFGNYSTIVTNGSARYCTTQQEDNASLEALIRGASFGYLDFSRIMLMRTGSDIDREPVGRNSVDWFESNQSTGGFSLSLANILNAGRPIVDDIIQNWDSVYAAGIQPTNYVGDVLNTLKSTVKADFGFGGVLTLPS